MYVVINGGGKIGSYLVHTLSASGHEVALIEKRGEIVERLVEDLPSNVLLVKGDGCDSEVQKDAGVESADIFVAATGEDDSNLVSCEIARIVLKAPRVIARVNNPKNAKIFREMGIEGISATEIIARMIEEETTMGDLRTLISLNRGDMAIVEIDIPGPPNWPKEGRRVSEIDPPKGSVLVAHIRGDDANVVNGDTLLMPGDNVIAIASSGVEDKLNKVLGG